MFRTISVAVIACGLETGKVLAIADDSDEAGAKAVLVKDNGSKVQQWKFEKDGDHYKLANRKDGEVLDVEGVDGSLPSDSESPWKSHRSFPPRAARRRGFACGICLSETR